LEEFVVSKGITGMDIGLLNNHYVEARSFSFKIAINPRDCEKASGYNLMSEV
jgi:hypothetical protein